MQRFVGLIVGIIFVAVGVFMYIKNDNLQKNCTKEVEATVVDMKEELNTDSDTTSYLYYPIVEYTAGDETVRVTMDRGSNTPAYEVNSKITILYNPNKVKEFIVKGEKSSSIISYVFIGLGALITCYGVYMVFKKEQ